MRRMTPAPPSQAPCPPHRATPPPDGPRTARARGPGETLRRACGCPPPVRLPRPSAWPTKSPTKFGLMWSCWPKLAEHGTHFGQIGPSRSRLACARCPPRWGASRVRHRPAAGPGTPIWRGGARWTAWAAAEHRSCVCAPCHHYQSAGRCVLCRPKIGPSSEGGPPSDRGGGSGAVRSPPDPPAVTQRREDGAGTRPERGAGGAGTAAHQRARAWRPSGAGCACGALACNLRPDLSRDTPRICPARWPSFAPPSPVIARELPEPCPMLRPASASMPARARSAPNATCRRGRVASNGVPSPPATDTQSP